MALPTVGFVRLSFINASPLPSMENWLYFILKDNVTQGLLGDHFGMGQSKCRRWIRFHGLYGFENLTEQAVSFIRAKVENYTGWVFPCGIRCS